MDSFPEYSIITMYQKNYCNQQMKWFYFDNMMRIHSDIINIDNKFPVIMSMIKNIIIFV